MDELTIILIRGIGIGAIYALIAMSFNIVHSASGVLNFAQGNFLVVGGLFAAASLAGSLGGWAWPVVLAIAVVVLGLAVGFQGFITLLPLRSSVEQHSWLVSTLATAVIINAIILVVIGSESVNVRSPFASVPLLGTRTPMPYILSTALALAWWAALHWFHRATRMGIAMRAIAQDLDAARAAGLRVRRLQLYAFVISGMITGSIGYAAAPIISMANDSGIAYSMNGFVAAVIGGLGSNTGALVGGLGIGVISMYAAFQYGGEYQSVISLVVLIAVLMLRPEGLFGHATGRRV
ncbi:MAG: branched-chain amino acid ABC transporter permease [Alphaproteobacteria bacterium]